MLISTLSYDPHFCRHVTHIRVAGIVKLLN